MSKNRTLPAVRVEDKLADALQAHSVKTGKPQAVLIRAILKKYYFPKPANVDTHE